MAAVPSTHQNNLKILRGYAYFAPENEDGTMQAEICMSPSSELTLNLESETAEYISAEEGVADQLDQTTISVARGFALTCNNMSDEILALWVVGDSSTVSQSSSSVTGERTSHVVPNRTIPLGMSANNGTGITTFSALTVESYEGANAATRANTTAYVVGDVVIPATPNDHWYMATAAGTSSGTPPTFPTNGTTVVDGAVTWQDMGLIEYTVADDYEEDTATGVIHVPTTGAIATAYGRVPASLRAAGRSFTLEVAYTRPAATFGQVQTSASATKRGRFRFVEKNAKGSNGVWFAPLINLAPTGDLALKSGTDYGAAQFTGAFQKTPSQAALYRNGVPQ